MHVPPELVKTIVDGLEEDIVSLRQCALVDHAFYSHSQRQLFKRISLGCPSATEMDSGTSPANKFYNHITEFPHLREYVLELAISDSWALEHTYSDSNQDVFNWVRTDEQVEKIIPLLTRLERLQVIGRWQVSFDEWSPRLQSAIFAAVPSLTGLSLQYLHRAPLQILNDIPKLRNLSLVETLFSRSQPYPAPSNSVNASLDTFNITAPHEICWSSIYPWLQSKDCSLDLTQLTSLHIDLPTYCTGVSFSTELEPVKWLINGCANSLRELYASFPPEATCPPNYDDTYFALDSLPNLQSLSLKGRLWSYETCNRTQNTFTWLVKVLSRTQRKGSLKHLHLSLMTVDWKSFTRDDYANAPWDDLIQALLRLEENTSISVLFSIYDSGGQSYIEDILQGRVAILLERDLATLSSTGNYSGDLTGTKRHSRTCSSIYVDDVSFIDDDEDFFPDSDLDSHSDSN